MMIYKQKQRHTCLDHSDRQAYKAAARPSAAHWLLHFRRAEPDLRARSIQPFADFAAQTGQSAEPRFIDVRANRVPNTCTSSLHQLRQALLAFHWLQIAFKIAFKSPSQMTADQRRSAFRRFRALAAFNAKFIKFNTKFIIFMQNSSFFMQNS